MVPWCSGYHVCLSRRRSRVQFSSEPPLWLCSSVGRARDWKSLCRWFDSIRSHHLRDRSWSNLFQFLFLYWFYDDVVVYLSYFHIYVSVAQLDRVFGYEPKGRGFESLQTHHFNFWLFIIKLWKLLVFLWQLCYNFTVFREMAQLGRALGLGPRGCRFKSCFPDHLDFEELYSSFFYSPWPQILF